MAASRRTRTKNARSAGFTFVDLMLVVAIIGIVTAVAVQTVDNDELKLDTTARAIAADLLEAQSLAIQTRVPFGIRFNVSRNLSRFVLADGTTPAASEATLRLLAGLDAGAVDRLLAAQSSGDDTFGAVTLASADFAGAEVVVFDTDGTPRAGGMVQINLQRLALRVRVQAVTGRIVVTAL